MDDRRFRSWPWDLLAWTAILAGLLFLRMQWNHLPTWVPTHFDRLGHANGWTPKSALPFIVGGLPAALWALISVLWALTVRLGHTDARAMQALRGPTRGILPAGVAAMLACLVGAAAGHPEALGWMLPTLLIAVLILFLSLVHRVRTVLPPSTQWRAGVFYVNAEDERTWVPKRFGLGWTLNFARPMAWIWMALLLALPVLAIVATRLTR